MRLEKSGNGLKIVLDSEDFLAGFVVKQSNNSTRVVGKGASFMSNFNPLTVIPGVAYPGQAPTNLTNVSVIDAVQIDAVSDYSSSKAYTIGGTKVHQIDIAADSITTPNNYQTTFPHTIALGGSHAAHSSVVGLSVEMYKTVSGGVFTNKLFYSWRDNTDWDVGVYDQSTTFDDDFMSTVPVTPLGTVAADLTDGVSKPHPLFRGSDDVLYMGSGRYVHSFDANVGATGTFTSRLITLPVGYTIVGFSENQYDLVIFATTAVPGTPYRALAQAFFVGADRQAGYYKSVSIGDDEVSCPFEYKGTVGCFARSRDDGRSGMLLYDGTGFRPQFKWTGNLPTEGGFEEWNDLACFQSDGLVYAIGKFDGEFEYGRFQISRGNGSTSGFLKSLKGGILYTSSGTTTLGGIDRLSASYNSSSNFQSTTIFPDIGFGKKCKFKYAEVILVPGTSAGRQLDIQLINESGTHTTLWNAITDDGTRLKTLKDYLGAVIPDFNSAKINLVWQNGNSAGSPGVVRVEIHFEPINYAD